MPFFSRKSEFDPAAFVRGFCQKFLFTRIAGEDPWDAVAERYLKALVAVIRELSGVDHKLFRIELLAARIESVCTAWVNHDMSSAVLLEAQLGEVLSDTPPYDWWERIEDYNLTLWPVVFFDPGNQIGALGCVQNEGLSFSWIANAEQNCGCRVQFRRPPHLPAHHEYTASLICP